MPRLATLLLLLTTTGLTLGQGTQADYDRAASLPGKMQGKLSRAKVEPRWFDENRQFWYRVELGEGKAEFIRVDVARNQRLPAFDAPVLAESLAQASKKPVQPTRLPFSEIEIEPAGLRVKFRAFDQNWVFDPEAKAVRAADSAPVIPPAQPPPAKTPREPRPRPVSKVESKWNVQIRNFNVVLTEKEGKGEKVLTTDGTAADGYVNRVFWSPDATRLVVLKTRHVETRKITLIESSPADQVQPRLHTLNYAKPGDELDVTRPHLFDVEAGKEIPVDHALAPNPWSTDEFRWSPDGKEFLYLYNQRGHGVLRLIGIDTQTGKARAVIDEVSKTFVDYAGKFALRFLPESDEIIWMSERSGWNHLYLIDRKTAQAKPITQGEWVVRRIERLDAAKRQLWLVVSGMNPQEDPYHQHLIRVDFDGSNLTRLTEGDGNHAVRFNPDGKTLLDSYSRVDLPPVHELRDAQTGKRLLDLEAADASALLQAGFRMPERFVAPGRDGKTPIHGVIWRPTNFDAGKKYPVIEYIYAGPHDAHVPKRFSSYVSQQGMAELGFVLVMIDGMGTSQRSKAFHDVCWKNLGDSGFPDRIAWIQAAAAKYPQLDASRVGIYGGSAGGQSSTRALLAFGDFYQVAVSDCGCHDNRMDKVWWNELWMGYPVGPHYAEQSNVTQAHKLKGKLLLIVGEMDRNVDPTSTLQVVNALVKANKDFDMLLVPGGGHGVGGSPYGVRRTQDFFVRHLLRVEPRQ